MHIQLSDLRHILNDVNVMERTLCTERNILYKEQETIILIYFALVKPLLNYYVHQLEEMQLKHIESRRTVPTIAQSFMALVF